MFDNIIALFLFLTACTSTFAIVYENLYDVNVNLFTATVDISLINQTFTSINCTSEPLEPTLSLDNQATRVSYPNRTTCQFKFDERYV
jgi:hypothetical protein